MAIRTHKQMKLYHGSPEIVIQPEIRVSPQRAMDFGQGFYCTTSHSQAEKWAKAKIRKGKMAKGYVNEYDFSYDNLGLIIKRFENEPTIEWLDFVIANRMNALFKYEYDIVIGPIANDDAFSAIETYIAEKDYSQERKIQLIKTLKTYKLKDQILFHTKASLKTLRFLKFKEIQQIQKKTTTKVNNKRKL